MKLLLEKSVLFICSLLLYVDSICLKGKWLVSILSHLCQYIANYDPGGYGDFCYSPYLTAGTILQCSEVLFVIAVVVSFANARGFKRWVFSNLVLLPCTAFGVYAIASSNVFFSPPIGFENPLNFFGYYFYLPVTFLIIALSYVPQRKRKRGRETDVELADQRDMTEVV